MTIIKLIEFDFAPFIVQFNAFYALYVQTNSKLIYEIYEKRAQARYNVLDFNRLHICSICSDCRKRERGEKFLAGGGGEFNKQGMKKWQILRLEFVKII